MKSIRKLRDPNRMVYYRDGYLVTQRNREEEKRRQPQILKLKARRRLNIEASRLAATANHDWRTYIWIRKIDLRNRETGINYIFHKSGYSGGLTPLLDRDGKPVISPVVNRQVMLIRNPAELEGFCRENGLYVENIEKIY